MKIKDIKNCFWVPEAIVDSSWVEHIPVAYFLISYFSPKLFVELGVYKGTSYFGFCEGVRISRKNTVCYGLDNFKGDEHSGIYGEEILNEVVIRNEVYNNFSSIIVIDFDEGLKYFDDESIDLLHIDGFHGYERVCHDFHCWLPKMSRNGIIVLHDTMIRTGGFGVAKFMDKVKRWYQVFEFTNGYGLSLVFVGEEVNFLLDEEEKNVLNNLFDILGNRMKNKVKEIEKDESND